MPGLDDCVALVDYDDTSRALITQLKYRGVRCSVRWLSTALAARARGMERSFDVVTWLPAADANKRRRGFDQGETLVRPLALRLRVPARRLLHRRDNQGQTGRSRGDRLIGPSLSPVGSCDGLSVLLVDDVMTTGASMRAGAVALRQACASTITGLVVAHRRFR